ncbi:uncharacterized protein LOC115816002 [Chanos chanos]|uniref:Uncharacterized protein LOC115816002 n=1 Tax=Chanos chanos TaxID=29144 RepID=A0A6J2VT13_CHACN|nr:uncharacterized protein LOC115816002 [Chanos chanos]
MEYNRFCDDNYKNWLKTTESLIILRSHIRDFVENETDTHHRDLREKIRNVFKDDICNSKCDLKKTKEPCEKCTHWKDTILQHHTSKRQAVHWDNCTPHLWPSEKWEVAKVYMPRGHKNHRRFEEFDIAAILNLMSNCKHFKKFVAGQCITKVIEARNQLMHSPDFRLSTEDREKHWRNVLALAESLKRYVPELENLKDDVNKFNRILEKQLGRVLDKSGDKEKPDDVESMKELSKFLDKEQQALKEKIEFLAQRYEEDKEPGLKEELLGLKSFFDQNKDLLEKLKPQIDHLKQIEEKVEKHGQQISVLNNRVDQLERVTNDPIFAGDPLKFKNHLYEMARKYTWTEPVFSEILDASGYTGQVEINGQKFTGTQVCNSKKSAHQEVAKIALEEIQKQPQNFPREQPSIHPDTQSDSSTSSSFTSLSTGSVFYGSVTVTLNSEVMSKESFSEAPEATESAYKEVASLFHLETPLKGVFYKTLVLEYFDKYNFPVPIEELDKDQSEKIICKLKLIGNFKFEEKEGSAKKKQAMQQAAKVALHDLSGVLRCSKPEAEGNYIGLLKETLEARSLGSPSYDVVEIKRGSGGEPVAHVPVKASPQTSRKLQAASEGSATPIPIVSSAISLNAESRDPSPQPSLRKVARVEHPVPVKASPQTSRKLQTASEGSATSIPIVSSAISLNAESRDSSPQPSLRKVARVEHPEIEKLMNVFALKPPSVTVDSMKIEENFLCTVTIRLDKYSFENKATHSSKKEAVRKTYLILGCAIGIFEPDIDESKSTMLVKQHFSQKNSDHPLEDVGKESPFFCTLKDISCSCVYEGQGASVEKARQEAFQKALCKLAPLFGYKSVPKTSSAKESEDQLTAMVTKSGLDAPLCSVNDPLHKATIQLKFQDYTLENTGQASRKIARNQLSARILGLLGEKTDTLSARNCLDEWFKQKGLPQPVFEDKEETDDKKKNLGARAKFSVSLSCSHPDWEESMDKAVEKLVKELQHRFENLTD